MAPPEAIAKGAWDAATNQSQLDLEQANKDIQVLIGLNGAASCPCCDGSGAYYDGLGEVCQCQWCYEKKELANKDK